MTITVVFRRSIELPPAREHVVSIVSHTNQVMMRKHSSLPIRRYISGSEQTVKMTQAKFGTLDDACETSERGGKLLGECESRKKKQNHCQDY